MHAVVTTTDGCLIVLVSEPKSNEPAQKDIPSTPSPVGSKFRPVSSIPKFISPRLSMSSLTYALPTTGFDLP